MARPPAPALDWTGLPSRSAPTMAPPPVTQLLPNVQLPTCQRSSIPAVQRDGVQVIQHPNVQVIPHR